MSKKEITSRMSAVVGFVVKVVFVKKIAIFDFQIPGFWLHHPFDPNMGPSKFPSSCPISMPLSPSDPRCWWSMHIYMGYFHPKYDFDISHKSPNYEISSPIVYFYRARYMVRKKIFTFHRGCQHFCVFYALPPNL